MWRTIPIQVIVMKSVKLLPAVTLMSLVLSGCAKDTWVAEEPVAPTNLYVNERCYMPDKTPRVRSGAGYVEQATEFYFQFDCDKYKLREVDATKVKTGNEDQKEPTADSVTDEKKTDPDSVDKPDTDTTLAKAIIDTGTLAE